MGREIKAINIRRVTVISPRDVSEGLCTKLVSEVIPQRGGTAPCNHTSPPVVISSSHFSLPKSF